MMSLECFFFQACVLLALDWWPQWILQALRALPSRSLGVEGVKARGVNEASKLDILSDQVCFDFEMFLSQPRFNEMSMLIASSSFKLKVSAQLESPLFHRDPASPYFWLNLILFKQNYAAIIIQRSRKATE